MSYQFINEDQAGYLKSRSMSNILRNMDEVKNYLNMSDKTGYVLVFDSVSNDVIIEAFKLFAFGEH